MKQLIRYLVTMDNNSATMKDLSENTNLTRSQVYGIVEKYNNIFEYTTSTDTVHYHAPFRIYDKTSLENAVANAFPKGIPLETLDVCYEFAHSDLNELKRQGKLLVHTHGKIPRYLIFSDVLKKNVDLSEEWQVALRHETTHVTIVKKNV